MTTRILKLNFTHTWYLSCDKYQVEFYLSSSRAFLNLLKVSHAIAPMFSSTVVRFILLAIFTNLNVVLGSSVTKQKEEEKHKGDHNCFNKSHGRETIWKAWCPVLWENQPKVRAAAGRQVRYIGWLASWTGKVLDESKQKQQQAGQTRHAIVTCYYLLSLSLLFSHFSVFCSTFYTNMFYTNLSFSIVSSWNIGCIKWSNTKKQKHNKHVVSLWIQMLVTYFR